MVKKDITTDQSGRVTSITMTLENKKGLSEKQVDEVSEFFCRVGGLPSYADCKSGSDTQTSGYVVVDDSGNGAMTWVEKSGHPLDYLSSSATDVTSDLKPGFDMHDIEESNRNHESHSESCSAVDHPEHYNSHPSGIECIDIARWHDFAIGNAIKYLWRCGLKHEEGKEDTDKAIEDLEKAAWYINDEIQKLVKIRNNS